MKRIAALCFSLLLALGTLFSASAAPTGEYNYYVPLQTHALRVYLDSSWESLAVNENTVSYALYDGDVNAGSILFYYIENDVHIPLFAYSVRRADFAYAPEGAKAPVWSEAHGDFVVELYQFAEISGKPYDVVLESLANPADAVEFFTQDEKWGFSCATPSGESVVARDLFLGSVTMVNVWATYCSPCIQEMPYLGELAAEYAEKGLRIVGVVSDVPEGTDAEYAKILIEETGANYAHVLTNSAMEADLLGGIQYVPTTIFLNAQGAEIGRYVGSMQKAEWAAIIEEMLAQ